MKKFITLLSIIGGIIIPVILMNSMSFSQDTEALNKGMLVYQTNCLQCHGENGDGNGPEAGALDSKSTDFTNSELMSSLSSSMLEKAIVEGVPDSAMQSWGGILSKEDVEAVILYIRTFQK